MHLVLASEALLVVFVLMSFNFKVLFFCFLIFVSSFFVFVFVVFT